MRLRAHIAGSAWVYVTFVGTQALAPQKQGCHTLEAGRSPDQSVRCVTEYRQRRLPAAHTLAPPAALDCARARTSLQSVAPLTTNVTCPPPARPVRFCLTLPRGRAIVYVLQVSRLGAGMKREAGAIPARSRRCDRPTGPHDATVLPQGREGAGARRAVSQKTCLRWLRASSRERQRSRTGPMAIGTPRLCRSCDAAVIVALASLGEGGVFCCPAGAGTPWTVPGDRPVGQQTSPS